MQRIGNTGLSQKSFKYNEPLFLVCIFYAAAYSLIIVKDILIDFSLEPCWTPADMKADLSADSGTSMNKKEEIHFPTREQKLIPS